MTKEEVKGAVQELLEKNEPEVVAEGFMRMYLDGKLEIEDLMFLVDLCGFELDEKFLNASKEEQKKLVEENGEEEVLEEGNQKEPKQENNAAEGNDRASKTEDYDGEKVYDKQGQPTQVTEAKGSEESEKEKAEKLFNMSF